MTSFGQAWRKVKIQFEKAGIDSPALDARLLGEHAFGFSNLDLILKEKEKASIEQIDRLEEYANCRLRGEPVARIIGQKEFYSLNFALNEEILVPRPETEILVDLALEHIKNIASPRVLDIGTGSGCIAIAILANYLSANAIAVDLSAKALLLAKENAKNNGVDVRVDFLSGSWFTPIEENAKFDLIVSNPPYIKTADIADLQREVFLHDPVLALDGGEDGLLPYRIIASEAQNHLEDEGALIVEFGQGQGQAIKEIFLSFGFENIKSYSDLAAIERVIVVKNN